MASTANLPTTPAARDQNTGNSRARGWNWGTIGAIGSIIGTIFAAALLIVNAIDGLQVQIEGIRAEATVRDLATQKALRELTEGQARIEGRLAERGAGAE